MLKTLIVTMLIHLVSGGASMVPVAIPTSLHGRCAHDEVFGGREQTGEIPKAVAKLFATLKVPEPTLRGDAVVQDHWYRIDDRNYGFCRDADMGGEFIHHHDHLTVTIRFTLGRSGWKASDPETLVIAF